MTARQAIVDALGTVPGLAPTSTHPKAPTPGVCWPRWVETRYQNGKLCNLAVADYDVYVILPNAAMETTVETSDGLLPQVATALGKIGTVALANPVAIQFDEGSTMPGFVVRVTPRNGRNMP